MHELIRKYYEATRLSKVEKSVDDEIPPLVWTKLFYKQYPRLKKIKLKPDNTNEEMEQVLKMRRSAREFEKKSLSFNLLSNLLQYGLGRIDKERRTYPSGGGRYPVETYLMVFDAEGLVPGAYHYDVKDNNLELLLEENMSNNSEEILSPYISWAPVAFVFTSVISRSEVKYGVNAYRFSLLEAGHMVQNLSLLCTKYKLGGCPIAGFVNNTVEEILDLTQDEIPLYVFACGYPKETD